jgi:soluble lytic murein transglycosylase
MTVGAGTAAVAAVLGLVSPSAAQVPAPTPRPDASEPAPAGPPIPIPHPQRIIEPPIENFQEAAAALGLGADADGGGSLFGNLTSPDYLANAAYDRLTTGDLSAAVQIAAASSDPAVAKMIEWLIAIGDVPEANATRMAEAAAAIPDWPGRALMQIRYEQAVRREEPSPETAVAMLEGQTPVLEPTILLLARSYVALGRDADAASLIRGVWRNDDFSQEAEDAFLSEFGDFLTVDDHRYRMSRLLYDGENDAALRTADLLSPDMQALAAAWAAVNNGRSNASSLLAAVPATLRSDPGYLYAQFKQFVQTYHYTDAANLLADAPTDPDALIDPEAWSAQRRTLARALNERGRSDEAYQILDGHAAVDHDEVSAIEFLAGWTALRKLDDAESAIGHFEALAANSSLPLSQSRAHYWLGRCYDALGQADAAEAEYANAAEYHTTFYGQLALLRLGETELPLDPAPVTDDATQTDFLDNDMVQTMIWLDGFGLRSEADILARALGSTLDDPNEVALLGQLAETRGDFTLALQIGKFAANRDLPVDSVAFSTAIFPTDTRSDHVELALVYAVARQESSFNVAAVSSAGALGLMQILPGTARDMARYVGLPFSESRLTTDAEYNAILGGAFLGTLVDRYDGNVLLALVAFNAGPGRADQWIETYGDPRSANVDPIDWIERIPFDETRNYVQRVLENLQVYRARLGAPDLKLAGDIGLTP